VLPYTKIRSQAGTKENGKENEGNERKRKKRRKQQNQEMMEDFKHICITSVGAMEGCWLKF
jgi:hypothetical protein